MEPYQNVFIATTPDFLEDDPELKDPDAIPTEEAVADLPFNEELQRYIVGAMVADYEWAAFCRAMIDAKMFKNKAHVEIVQTIFGYLDSYGQLPQRAIMEQEFYTRLGSSKAWAFYKMELTQVYDTFEPNLHTKQYLKDQICKFSVKNGTSKAAVNLLNALDKPNFNAAKHIKEFEEAVARAKPQENKTFAIGERINTVRPDWLIKGLIRKRSVCILFGESGSYKTWLSIDLALSVATGTDVLGLFGVEKGKVFYIISEGADDFEYRCMGWLKAKGVEAPSINDFTYCPNAYDFGSPEAVAQCLADIKERIGSTDLIVVDTLSKNFTGDPDKNEGMAAFLRGIEKLRDETGATILVLHHTGWSNTDRERGGRAIRDNVDTSILVKREGSLEATLECKKQKLGAEFPNIPVVFDTVRLPEYDHKDEQITALVAKYAQKPSDDSDGLGPKIRELIDLAIHDGLKTQQELVAFIQEHGGWGEKVPGVKKLKDLIDAEVGQSLVKKSIAGRYEYTLMGG